MIGYLQITYELSYKCTLQIPCDCHFPNTTGCHILKENSGDNKQYHQKRNSIPFRVLGKIKGNWNTTSTRPL